MQNKIQRKLFQGFMQIHILHHAQKNPFYGVWMIEELKEHDYEISPGSLYPMLHNMESSGLLKKEDRLDNGKIRKYYSITPLGSEILEGARKKAYELFKELNE